MLAGLSHEERLKAQVTSLQQCPEAGVPHSPASMVGTADRQHQEAQQDYDTALIFTAVGILRVVFLHREQEASLYFHRHNDEFYFFCYFHSFCIFTVKQNKAQVLRVMLPSL